MLRRAGTAWGSRAAMAAAALAAAGSLAGAAPGDRPAPGEAAPAAAPVLGGSDVPQGAWQDVAAVLFGGFQGCTGVLIAPTVVMTAAHCLDGSLDQVLIGTNSLAAPSRGETIGVARRIPLPDPFDAAVLLLERPSTMPPRRLATGWVQDQIVDGATVTLVGYGAIDRDATVYVDDLQEARTTVTDAGCTRSAGCEPAARPDGEIGAGGMGIDTCLGDSGGPLYLMTPDGAFLAGITSRGYDTNQYDCSEGGIYVRPDKDTVVAYVEQQTGLYLPDGRGPRADRLRMLAGTSASIEVDPDDPRAGATYTWTVESGPAHGTATIDPSGATAVLTVTAAADYLGDDAVVVRATDTADPRRSARGRVEIEVVDDLDAGCCGAGGGRARAVPGLVVVVILAGRRRRRMPT